MSIAENAPARMLPPGSTIGVIGGGQLGRMLAMAAAPLGLRTHILTPEAHAPAGDCAAQVFRGAYENAETLKAFHASVDIVTYEFENVPVGAVEQLTSMGAVVAPGAKALEIAQDRLIEKQFIESIGGATAPYFAVEDLPSLEKGLAQIGRPAILKTRRLGYDGKGQTRINPAASEPGARANDDDLDKTWRDATEKAWSEIGARPAILEGFVDFIGEFSVIGARTPSGDIALFDPARNIHRNGILVRSTVPVVFTDTAQTARALDAAAALTKKIMDALDYVGVIGVEFFLTRDGDILVNEFAPRVHNSGHWTLDACACSQFEQHIRAIANWPLGHAGRHSDAVMENMIGDECDQWRAVATAPQTALHLYGKGRASPGRKMGHFTRITPKSPAF